MKIALINTFDIMGGAARAAYRLHKGLLGLGEECRMVVRHKNSDAESVKLVELDEREDLFDEDRFLSTFMQTLYINANRSDVSNTIFSLPYSGVDLASLPIIQTSDILNLHWVAWFQSPVTLHRLFATGKPVVWTLHDQWAFTGGCHYSAGCLKYRSDCAHCPQLAEDTLGLPAAILKDKLGLFRNANLTIVTPSRWMADCARESSLFKSLRVEVIPNALETDVFMPFPKKAAKERLSIPPETTVLLFGAEQGNEKRKGFHELIAAMKYAMQDEEFRNSVQDGRIRVMCFGYPGKEIESIGFKIISLGYLKTDEEMSTAYSAADLFILPSLEDNLPNTMLEALSCAAPVVGFAIGGIPDVVIDGVTGRLAPAYDHEVLGKIICDLVADPAQRERMGKAGRELLAKEFPLNVQAVKYRNLFQELVRASAADKRSSLSEREAAPAQASFEAELGENFRRVSQDVLFKPLKEFAPVLQKEFKRLETEILAERKAAQSERSAAQALQSHYDKLNVETKKILSKMSELQLQHNTLLAAKEDRIEMLKAEAATRKVETDEFLAAKEEQINMLKTEAEAYKVKADELLAAKEEQIKALRAQYDVLLNSLSWKITAPARAIHKVFKGK